MLIVFLGAPGAGKGTQARALAADRGLTHLATGDMLRLEVSRGTELGRMARTFMDRGDLVPDNVMIDMIKGRLAADGDKGLLLDGFPRTLEQAAALDKALEADGRHVDAAIYFNVRQEELVRRLAGRATCPGCQAAYHETSSPPREENRCDHCGTTLVSRDDDQPEAVRNRLEVYDRLTAPVLDHYRTAGKLREVDGEQSVEAVQADLVNAVDR